MYIISFICSFPFVHVWSLSKEIDLNMSNLQFNNVFIRLSIPESASFVIDLEI
jgi:hypothetical protein